MTAADAPIARLLRVAGRVQGVGYRDWCVGQAHALKLLGWVRNRRDGSVEVLLQGSAEAVARMEALLGRGPSLARVDRVSGIGLPPSAATRLDRFECRPTE